ncbi:cobalt-precorrin-6A reductase [Clostridium sp.]|uniref:cobalt-precorrin-6A reductase n=1 Tax=Clostridium sp. TaxID=1506 RepID=UPI0034648111
MVGFILGTSEGREFLSLANKYTDRIVVSTATSYGGDLLKEYKIHYLNTEPLDIEGLKSLITRFNIKALVDASHPYAKEVSKNAREACSDVNIQYVRYERPGVLKGIEDRRIIRVRSYEELESILNRIDGNILNTTGSRNIKKIMSLNIKNRIIHRVLPSKEVMDELLFSGIRPEDIVAIKGPIGYSLNKAFIEEYNAKAIITKDSGVQGGALEKVKSALDSNVDVIIIEREDSENTNIFTKEEEVINYLRENNYI